MNDKLDRVIKLLNDLAKDLQKEDKPFESMDIQTACNLLRDKTLTTYVVTANLNNGVHKYTTKVVLPAESPKQASESTRLWLSAGYNTTCQILSVDTLKEPVICEM